MYNNRKGLFGSAPMASAPAMPQTKPREGPSGLQRGLGIAGDVFLGLAGQQGVFGPMMQQRQLMQEQQGFRVQQGKLQREQDQTDWLARQEYERANRPAPEPDAFERALRGAGIDPASPEGQQLYRDRAASMASDPNDQFVTVNIPGRGTYAGPRSGLAAFAGAPVAPSADAPETLPPGFFDAPATQQPMGAPQGRTLIPGSALSVAEAGQYRANFPQGREGDMQFADWMRRNNVRMGAF